MPDNEMPDNDTSSASSEQFGSWKPTDYLEQRVKQYQAWYDKKSVSAKARYLQMRTAIVLGGVFVPYIINSSLPYKEIIASVVSLVVAACVALDSVYHFGQQWKNYRSAEQFLSREQILFLTGEGGYKKYKSPQAAFIYLVERCENAIEAENASTLNVMTLGQQSKKPESADGDDEKTNKPA